MLAAGLLTAAVPPVSVRASETQKLTGEAEELLSGFKLGEEEQEFLDEMKERLIAGELDSEEDVLDAIAEAEEKFDYTFSEEQKEKIVSLVLKVQDLGLDSEKIAEIAEKLIEKYGSQVKESADAAIQEKIVEPAKEAVVEGSKSAVKNFFGEMKKSLVGFWEKLTKDE